MIIEYFTRRTNNKLEAKNIVSFEIALKLKEAGFNIPCYHFYAIDEDEDGEIIYFLCHGKNSKLYDYNEACEYISAPNFTEALNWIKNQNEKELLNLQQEIELEMTKTDSKIKISEEYLEFPILI